MKAILAGMGAAGTSWYRRLREKGIETAVVERNEALREAVLAQGSVFYTDVKEAIEKEQPDFLLNVTSPHAHGPVNHLAFDYRLPVLSEKPISFDYAESAGMTERAVREGIPFMIAENYRRMPDPRRVKRLIDDGAIGRLSSMDAVFNRYHHVHRHYRVSLLDDIAVHHFDMMRYFAGVEGIRLYAERYCPLNAWGEAEDHNAAALVELEGGIRATYSGTITSHAQPTPWHGNWRIDGTEGSIELTEKSVALVRRGVRTPVEDDGTAERADILEEFLTALREGTEPDTSAADYMHTQALVQAAKESAREQRAVSVDRPHYGDTAAAWKRKEGSA
ncbi:Gfo/Idh/MocA family oxidoreductase [Paenibacillus aurantius]|uniref:Gfo/Idh/MocA family oxidoreductase n=1 Tax=Paenibacillus aurantius TaxID=2918900 RepID=A0AA96LGW5_9BACL|nr:Gfo/Idh/MocA family oxidoreductase [Paenibacillus aurantius]WNQ12783.1 Gfo/Idh/MocA family oxidoreductase [Paenibacillus aurantius]